MILAHDRRLQLLAVAALLPALLLSVGLLSLVALPWFLKLGLGIAVLLPPFFLLKRLRLLAQRPLQTLSNVLAAIREGDYSFRARTNRGDDPLATVFQELNSLSELLQQQRMKAIEAAALLRAELLQQQRMKAIEAAALLRAVMSEIDVAVFAFDEEGLLRLVNRAGESLLARPQERLLGFSAAELGLEEALDKGPSRLLELDLPGRAGRFELRRGSFRQGGRPHQLLVLSDLTRPLREEERQAWQRLIRVMGHEINNSLAPIQSLSGSIGTMIDQQGEDWQSDARQGLAIIASRAQALGRFMEAYTRLARLPAPRLGAVQAESLVRKVAGLELRLPVGITEGPALTFQADGDQVEQALINLLRNAVDAALETQGGVSISWVTTPETVSFIVEDEGPGLPTGGNLFVPFFTTKPGGSGIGLLLARQIAEGHGGTLRLTNREASGARAVLQVPLETGTSD